MNVKARGALLGGSGALVPRNLALLMDDPFNDSKQKKRNAQ
jgi:hypothetical protein